ncbi:MAG: GTPase HflX, partial [Bacilli bacterium]|nr:GTPase HflX [Bacilli bacterium]
RRKLENRISILEKELKEMVEDRKIQRQRRIKNEIPVVALVGYTNSGKSTLMNTILECSKIQDEDKKVYVEDMLFATLETTTRQIILEDNKKFLLTDTVGFVSRLPHQLVKAFRSTLEEITEADLILHVIDISNKNFERQLKTTEQVLKEIGVSDIPIIHVYNKIDVNNTLTVGEGVFISAKYKTNIDILINKIREVLFSDYRTVKMLIPYSQGSIYSVLKEHAYIKEEEYTDKGIEIIVELNSILYEKYKHLLK